MTFDLAEKEIPAFWGCERVCGQVEEDYI